MRKITSLLMLLLMFVGTAVAQITSLSETSNTKCYTITNSRSTWAVDNGGTQLTTIAKLGLAFSATDAKQQFALITPDEGANYYLWSVNGQGYVTPSGTLTTDVGACKPVYLNSSKVMYFDNTHYINTGGSNQIVIDDWGTADAGNILTIAEAGNFDPTAALAVFATPTCNVTYVISDANGVVYTSPVVSMPVGAEVTTLPTEYQRAFCTYTVTPTTTVDGDNTVPVTVTYSLPFTVSASYDDATWYFAKIRNTKYIKMTSTEPYTLDATKDLEDTGKWAFVGTPYAGFSILNKAAGASMVLTKDGNYALMRSGSTETWDLVANGAGFNLLRHGSAQDYINDNNSKLGFWVSAWGATDAGGQWLIEEAPAATVDVTYNVVLGGTVVASATEKQGIGAAPAVPSSLEFAYTTYTYDVTELTAATTTVVATPTFSTPYTLSTDFDNATWYYVRAHASTSVYSNYYISTNEDAIVWASGNSMTDAYKWALVGNPIQGVKLVNKAAGATKCAQGTNPVAMGTDTKLWTLKEQTNYTDVTGGKGFGLYDASLTYINCQGGTLKYWRHLDQGSTFWVEEIPNTPFYDALLAVVEPYVTAAESHAGEYFQLAASGEAVTNFMSAMVIATQNAENNIDMTEAEYNAALGYFNDALVMPENGYYRLKSRMVDEGDTNYGYVGVNSSATLVGNIADPTADASTVFYVKKNSAGYYSFTSQGVYGTVASQSTPVVADANEHNFILAIAAPGYAYIKTARNVDRSCYHVAATQGYQVVGWGSGAQASHFVFEPATSLTINLNTVEGKGYATTYLPFAVRFDAGEVVPYTVRENTAGDMAIYTSIDSNEVPAGTGVLLISETGATSATATIISSAEAVENNELTGHYLAGEVASALVLNSVGGQVGFYSLAAGSTLAANRAFLGNDGGSIRGLQLVAAGAATGIQNVETKAAQNAEVFDLQGRRVQNAQKGLYIVNGKKVIL